MDGITVFGGVGVWASGQDITPAGRIPRRLLACLTLHADVGVGVDALIEAGWGDDAPPTVNSACRTHLSRLRRVLDGGLVATDGRYRLTDADQIDLVRYQQYVSRARSPTSTPAQRLEFLGAALELWRGRPWGPLGDEPWLADAVRSVEERHRTVQEEWAEVVAAGHPTLQQVDMLRDQAHQEPLREQRWACLVRALAATGRTSEALSAYQKASSVLAEELGTRPGSNLSSAYDALFHQPVPSPSIAGPRSAEPAGPIVGRRSELEAAERLLGEGMVVTLTGIGGIGKSRIAQELAARAQRRGEQVRMLGAPPRELTPRFARELAAQLGVTTPTEADGFDALVNILAAVDLLVIDAAETCPTEVFELVEVLRLRRPRLHLVITSRMILGHPAEVAVAVNALPVPSIDEDWHGTSVELLGRCKGVVPGDDGSPLAELIDECRSTGGVPLLVQLAARNGPSAQGDLSDVERVRQTSLELVDELEAPTRTLAFALAVLPGGISVELAGRLLDGNVREAGRRTRHLLWLGLARSATNRGARCLLMLDPIAAPIRDQVDGATRASIQRALIDELTAIGDTMRPSLLDPPDLAGFRHYDALAVNLRAVLEGESDRRLDVAAAAADYLGWRGHANDAGGWLTGELAATDPLVRARAALAAAQIGRFGGNIVGLAAALEEAVATFDDAGDRPAAAFAALHLGIGQAFAGDLDASERAVVIARKRIGHQDRWSGQLADLIEGWLRFLRGDHSAGTAQVEAVARNLEASDEFGATLAHFLLAACLVTVPERTQAQLAHAKRLAVRAGDAPVAAICDLLAADLLGDRVEAVAALRKTAVALDAAGLPERGAVARTRAATLLVQAGSPGSAIDDLLGSVRGLDRAGSAWTQVALAALARSLAATDTDLARDAARLSGAVQHYSNGYANGIVLTRRACELLGPLDLDLPGPPADAGADIAEQIAELVERVAIATS